MSEQGEIAQREDVLRLLNRDMANEMNTMLTYLVDGLLARGSNSLDMKDVADSFARQDFEHVTRLATRIAELEGLPELAPTQIDNNASIPARIPQNMSDNKPVKDMLIEALENEMRSTIEYRHQIRSIGLNDPTTRLMLESILAEKESQATTLRQLLGPSGRD